VLELLADLLEGAQLPREPDERDIPAMRAEAARKLEELAEVPGPIHAAPSAVGFLTNSSSLMCHVSGAAGGGDQGGGQGGSGGCQARGSGGALGAALGERICGWLGRRRAHVPLGC
jgi:hypothetical protein